MLNTIVATIESNRNGIIEVWDHTSELGTYFTVFVGEDILPRTETENEREAMKFARYLATR